MQKSSIAASCWELNDDFILYLDKIENFYVIFGKYIENGFNEYSLGVCWEKFPKSHNTLTPIVLSVKVAEILLNGLLIEAVNNNDDKLLKRLKEIKNQLGKS